MAYKEYREMKVYEQSGYNYQNTPTLVLKGKWLEELGFSMGDKVSVKCEIGRITIIKADDIWAE
jgi:toxic protein SymE